MRNRVGRILLAVCLAVSVQGLHAAPLGPEWMVALVPASAPTAASARICGGSLIDRDWVLTAAHGVVGREPSELDVVFPFSDTGEIRVPVVDIIVHPDYRSEPEFEENDLALVRLAWPMDLETIGLLDDPRLARAGTRAAIVGWHEDPDELAPRGFVATLMTLAEANSEAAYGGVILPSMLPAGFGAGGTDSCRGDSGGPLLVYDAASTEMRLAGIISFGDGCGKPHKYGIHTRVTHFVDWIESQMAGDQAARTLEFPVFHESRLTMLDDRDESWGAGRCFRQTYFLENLPVGERVRLRVRSGQFLPRLTLRNAADEIVGEAGQATAGAALTFVPRIAGGYTLDISTVRPEETGSFALSLTEDVGLPELTILEGGSGKIGPGDKREKTGTGPGFFYDEFNLNGVYGGEVLRLVLTPLSVGFDPFLVVLDADTGGILFFDDDNGLGKAAELILPAASGIDYRVRVSSAVEGQTGSYRLDVVPARLPVLRPLDEQRGVLTASDAVDPFAQAASRGRFYRQDYLLKGVTSGQTVEACLVSRDFDALLYVIDTTTGEIVAENNNEARGVRDAAVYFRARAGAQYLLRVSTAKRRETGEYVLRVF